MNSGFAGLAAVVPAPPGVEKAVLLAEAAAYATKLQARGCCGWRGGVGRRQGAPASCVSAKVSALTRQGLPITHPTPFPQDALQMVADRGLLAGAPQDVQWEVRSLLNERAAGLPAAAGVVRPRPRPT